MDWAAPQHLSQWFQRLLSTRSLLMLLLLLALIVSELRFDWVERSLGIVLASTNAHRPQSGAIWEIGQRKQHAHQTLEQIVTDRQSTEQDILNADSLQQIVMHIDPDQWVMIPVDRFRALYLNLPPDIAEGVMPAFDFLNIIQSGQWDRTYIERVGDGLRIYLLDENNRVLKQVEISTELMRRLSHSETPVEEHLEEMLTFENRIYTAKRFFDAFEKLDAETRKGILQEPRILIRQPGVVARVGISDEVMSGTIELGFEFDTGTRRFVILNPAQEWAVWRIRSLLEGRKQPFPREPGK